MPTRNRRRKPEQGYILLTLMLFVALMAIAAVAIAPSFLFQMRREREEELVHRGVQYSRAIRKYFKKFGRYPGSLNELQNTNNIRFLRRRYKDPITGKDFKLLHYGEVQMMGGAVGITGATPATAMAGTGAAGANPNGGFNPGTSGTQASRRQDQPGQETTSPSATSNTDSQESASSDSTGSPQIASGPIVGVASASKAASIREFGGKDHYNQWLFIYDPSMDRGGLITTPAEPPLQNTVANVNGQGTPGTQSNPAPGMGSNTTTGSNPFGLQQQPMQPSPSR